MRPAPLTSSHLRSIARRAASLRLPLTPHTARQAVRLLRVELPKLIAAYEQVTLRFERLNSAGASQALSSLRRHEQLAARIDELARIRRSEPTEAWSCGDAIEDDCEEPCFIETSLAHQCGRPDRHEPAAHECNRCGAQWSSWPSTSSA